MSGDAYTFQRQARDTGRPVIVYILGIVDLEKQDKFHFSDNLIALYMPLLRPNFKSRHAVGMVCHSVSIPAHVVVEVTRGHFVGFFFFSF